MGPVPVKPGRLHISELIFLFTLSGEQSAFRASHIGSGGTG
jgi:hypothetical protein